MFTQWFLNRGIRFRIMTGFIIVMVIGAASSIYGLVSVNKVGQELKFIAEEDIPMTNLLTGITTKQLEQAVLFERALRLANINVTEDGSANELRKTEEEFIKLGKEVEAQITQFELKTEEALRLSNDAKVTEKFRKIEQAARIIEVDHKNYEKHVEAIFKVLGKEHSRDLDADVLQALREEKKLDKELLVLLKDLEKFTEKSAKEAEQHEQVAIKTMSILTFAGFVLGFLFAILISNGITGPLRRTLYALNDIAEGEGDLTRRLDDKGQDEVAQVARAFNKFTDKIEKVVASVRGSVSSINVAISEINDGNTNLSQRTEEQASSLEETASSMEEMTSTVQQNAENATAAQQLAEGNRQRAAEGSDVVQRAVSSMTEISESSNKIADIISTIDGIAFQTNLLALNAAVEAARAGEQGRGFAVVAGEVRTLAQSSADAAKEIKQLIENSVDKVKTGTQLVNESGKTLEELVQGIKEVASIVNEISAASTEQAAGIEQVNQAVVQMDDMTQQNATLVEEATAASRSLQDQTMDVAEKCAFFKVSAVLESQFTSGIITSKPDNSHSHSDSQTTFSPTNLAKKRVVGGKGVEWEDF